MDKAEIREDIEKSVRTGELRARLAYKAVDTKVLVFDGLEELGALIINKEGVDQPLKFEWVDVIKTKLVWK